MQRKTYIYKHNNNILGQYYETSKNLNIKLMASNQFVYTKFN